MVTTLLNGLIVTVIGLAVVFLGLTILIGLIKILTAVTANLGKKKEMPAAAPAVKEAPVEVAAEEEEDDASLVAAIMAAVSCVMEGNGNGNGFVVRRIRRLTR